MIVSRLNFDEVLDKLVKTPELGLDTETYGLRMYHGHRIFSLILATPEEAFYFNFKSYDGQSHDLELGKSHWSALNNKIFRDPSKTYYIQRAANFDMQMLWASEAIELAGTVHCTKEIHRLIENDLRDYSLKGLLERIGLAKDETVENYIAAHRLYTQVVVPGKAQKEKQMHFDRVPFEIIAPYGEMDGTGTIALGLHQKKRIAEMDAEQPELVKMGRTIDQVYRNELRLTKTIYRMKKVGVGVDRNYCAKAIDYETSREQAYKTKFRALTGSEYSASPKLFAELFKEEKHNWSYTDKGNPSFDADAIEKLEHPAAKLIVGMRDAKSKADFYNGFLWHSDADGNVHPDFNSGGTVHGRFSSSNPNFQNLKKEDSDEEIAGEFTVRRAIKPRDGYVLIMPDYKQMEYCFALEQACRLLGESTELSKRMKAGGDFHDETAALTKLVTGNAYGRKIMKVANFLTLYGGGPGALATNLKISHREAKEIQMAIKASTPEIANYISQVIRTGEERGYIVNWFGRRCYFQFKSMAYKAPNYHVSGGCADIVKVAMNRADDYFFHNGLKSRMIMQVHDEIVFEVHESELEKVPRDLQQIMEDVFISKYVPLVTEMEWSAVSLGDKTKGYPA